MNKFLLALVIFSVPFNHGIASSNKKLTFEEWNKHYDFTDFKGYEVKNLDTYQYEAYEVNNLDIFDFSTLTITPSNIHKKDVFTVNTKIPSIVSSAKKEGDELIFNINGFSDNKRPSQINKDDISITYNDSLVDFSLSPSSSKQLVFDLVLDDSGSMAGYRMQKLLRAVTSFMAEIDGKNHLCRITWFSSTFLVQGDYAKCGRTNFGNLQPRGEHKGTSIVGALENSYKDLNQLDASKYSTNVLIVGDGADGNLSPAIPALNDAKYLTTTFAYIIDNNTSHSYKDISDYVKFQADNFDENLFNYMLASLGANAHQNTIKIHSSQIDSSLKKKP